MSRLMTAVLFIAAIAAAAWGAVAFGTREWHQASDAMMEPLLAATEAKGAEAKGGEAQGTASVLDSLRPAAAVALLSATDSATLPAPVARYFALALSPGQRPVRRARVRHEGDFALRPNEWKPFTSRQLYTVAPRGFVWDARIRYLPFVPMLVRDSYVGGRGSMRGALAGVVKVADQEGGEGLATGALLRYLAESAWFPTALLPSQGVQWTPVDDTTARATVTDSDVTVWMDVHFGASGSIVGISAIRQRDVDGEPIPTPWEGRFSEELLTVDGMKIPASGEVAWLLPEGKHTYWRGRVVEAAYEYGDCPPRPPVKRPKVEGCS